MSHSAFTQPCALKACGFCALTLQQSVVCTSPVLKPGIRIRIHSSVQIAIMSSATSSPAASVVVLPASQAPANSASVSLPYNTLHAGATPHPVKSLSDGPPTDVRLSIQKVSRVCTLQR